MTVGFRAGESDEKGAGLLYLGDASPELTDCTVPNVMGLGYDAAKARLEAAGFYMRSSGTGSPGPRRCACDRRFSRRGER